MKRVLPNFYEFYQKALVPIGENDYLSGKFSSNLEPSMDYTHWLIALEGDIIEETGVFHWNVNVFPANMDGSFYFLKPYFASSYYKSIDDALEYSRKIENMAKEDKLVQIANR